MTNHETANKLIAMLNSMDVSDDLHEVWSDAYDKVEDLAIAIEHEAEAEPDRDREAWVASSANAMMTSNQIAYYREANQ